MILLVQAEAHALSIILYVNPDLLQRRYLEFGQLMQNKDWTALGLKIDQYRLQIRTEEQAVLRELKDRVCKDFDMD